MSVSELGLPEILVLLFFLANAIIRYLLIAIVYADQFDPSGDSSNHLAIIMSLKKKWILRKISQYEIPNNLCYPILFHQYTAIFFPKKLILSRSYLPNYFLFILFSALYSSLILWLGYKGYYELTIPNLLVLLIFQFFSQTNLSFAGDNLNYLKLSGRYLSRELFNYNALFTLLYLNNGHDSFLVVAVITLAFGLLASTIGRQLAMWVAISFSILALSPIPFLIFVSAFILALLVSPFRFFQSFIDTTRYTQIYKNYMKPTNLANVNKVVSLSELFKEINAGRLKQVVYLLYAKEPTRFLINFPQILIFLILIPIIDLSLFDIAFFTSIFLVYILTNTYRFMHLGEGFRYLEYTMIVLVPIYLVSKLEVEPITMIILTIAYALMTIVGYFLTWYFDIKGRPDTKVIKSDLKQILQKMDLNEDSVVFPVDFMLAREITALSKARSFWWQSGGITRAKMFETYFEFYPYLRIDWAHIFEKHHVSHVLMSKRAVDRLKDEFGKSYDTSRLNMIEENDSYIAYTV